MSQQERNVVIPSSAHCLTSSSGLRDRFDPPGTGLTHVRTLGVRTTGGLEGCTGARDWGELSSYTQMSVGALQVCRAH